MMKMVMVLCPKAGSLCFMPPGDGKSAMVPVAFLTVNNG